MSKDESAAIGGINHRKCIAFILLFMFLLENATPTPLSAKNDEKNGARLDSPIEKLTTQTRFNYDALINLTYLQLNHYKNDWNPFDWRSEEEDEWESIELEMLKLQNHEYEYYLQFKSRSDLLKNIYKQQNISGYEIQKEEENYVTKQGGDSTYGELVFESMEAIIKILQFGPDDIFYDLGSGVGKFNLFVDLAACVKKNVGIELSESRHNGALLALRNLQEYQLDGACADTDQNQIVDTHSRVHFIHGDIAEVDISDATIIFMAAVCFPEKLLLLLVEIFITLKPGLCIITLKELPKHPQLLLTKELSLPTSWSSKYRSYIYELIDPQS